MVVLVVLVGFCFSAIVGRLAVLQLSLIHISGSTQLDADKGGET